MPVAVDHDSNERVQSTSASRAGRRTPRSNGEAGWRPSCGSCPTVLTFDAQTRQDPVSVLMREGPVTHAARAEERDRTPDDGVARGRLARGQRSHADASWEAGGDDAAARQGRPARRSRHHCEDGAPRQRAPTAEASRSPRPFASATGGRWVGRHSPSAHRHPIDAWAERDRRAAPVPARAADSARRLAARAPRAPARRPARVATRAVARAPAAR